MFYRLERQMRLKPLHPDKFFRKYLIRVRRQIASYTTRILKKCHTALRLQFEKVSNDLHDKQHVLSSKNILI